MKVVVLFVCLLVSGLEASEKHSGMELDYQGKSSVDESVDVDPAMINTDTGAMRMSSMPDADMQSEDAQPMVSSNEDHVTQEGEGAHMQLSGPTIPTVTTQDRLAEIEDDDTRVAEDMDPAGAPLSNAIDTKQTQLSERRQQVANAASSLEQQTTDAKKLISEAYAKQAYLHDLQKQLLEQSAALEAKKAKVADAETEAKATKDAYDRKLHEIGDCDEKKKQNTHVFSAIQSQMSELDEKLREFEERKHAFEAEETAKAQELSKMQERVEKMKLMLDDKESALSKKEEEVKQLYVDLNSMTKNTQRHETHIKHQEADLKKQQLQLKEKEAKLEARARDVFKAETGEQVAIQTSMELTAPLSELPPAGHGAVGPMDDTDIDSQISKQPKVNFTTTIPTPSGPPSDHVDVEAVDRSTRSIETFLSPRSAETYGQKLLTGQAYSAKFTAKPDPTNPHDEDGKCRNSRGVEVPCTVYSNQNSVPPVVPSVTDLIDDWYSSNNDGPCVLKCLYHKGPTHTGSAGSANVEEVAVEIPTKTVSNTTIACPKTNNGYPFLSCQLVLDDSDKCRTQCIFDGDVNPLKPRMMGIGAPLNGQNGFQFDPEEFRTLAHSTYRVTTNLGCKSSMKADPLVACEVVL